MANRGDPMPRPAQPAPDGPEGGPHRFRPPDWLEEDEELGAAPTDFRRNIWLLLVIIGVVLGAWLANRLEKSLTREQTEDAAPSRSHAPVLAPGPDEVPAAR
ncbi:MAG: hypothetical protein QGH74_03455 [Candidatus Brocadiia bacterium]|nr:hypothetical protein [Candidatus Brocadiia bacterium]